MLPAIKKMEELETLIYVQLMELYTFDLEIELLAEKLKNTQTGIEPIKDPYPWQQPNTWPNHPPVLYGPYIVTCDGY
jgi:hypothetical protein